MRRQYKNIIESYDIFTVCISVIQCDCILFIFIHDYSIFAVAASGGEVPVPASGHHAEGAEGETQFHTIRCHMVSTCFESFGI